MVEELRGWLLDVYADPRDGITLWLLGEDGTRRRLSHSLTVTFYAAGPDRRLRALWSYLRRSHYRPRLSRARRTDLFAGTVDVLAIELQHAPDLNPLFRQVRADFPDLDYFDADIPVNLRHAAAHDLFPLARCALQVDQDGRVLDICALDSPWDLDIADPPLRQLLVEPDCDPNHAPPRFLELTLGRKTTRLAAEPLRDLIILLQAAFNRHDPDVVVTRYGDTWLFPKLLEASRKPGLSVFNPNRDQRRLPAQNSERSFFAYGQVVYRGGQVRLFGRWHIDQQNAVLFGQYGLTGVLEQARVTGLPVQDVARKSPGAGITAMQMQLALRSGILVPFQKQQAESFKQAGDLIEYDRGGLVYQPLVGLHRDVAEIDFVSMYPSIMVHFNISPETVISPAHAPGEFTPLSRSEDAVDNKPSGIELPGLHVDRARPGIVPMSLKPLLVRRVAIKRRLAALDRMDCRYAPLKARSDALKWLLVVSFGYLGFKNARFGRIESHEAVTAYSREALLRAKEAAEDLGYRVLHMYVDGLWVQQRGKRTPRDLAPLLDEVQARTGLPVSLEGIYRWIVFLPSRIDERVPVANRFYGLFSDGRLKMRGIDSRRRDTPPFVKELQLAVLGRIARTPDGGNISESLPAVIAYLRWQLNLLRTGQVPLEKLLVTQKLSRPIEEYRAPSPAARAAAQLAHLGRVLKPGQKVRFLYTIGEPGVLAWDLPAQPAADIIDATRYETLLLRAAQTVLEPFGIERRVLNELITAGAYQPRLAFGLSTPRPAAVVSPFP